MKDEHKTKEDFGETSASSVEPLSRAELINELVEIRQRVAELEAADTERKRAEEALRRRAEEMAALVEMNRAITEDIDLKETLDRILSNAQKIIPVSDCSVTLVDESSEDLVVEASTNGEIGLRISPTAPSAVGWVVKTKQILAEEDVSSNPIFSQQLVQRYRFKSGLAVPIIYKDKAIGTLSFGNRHVRRAFSDSEKMMAQAFAYQAAIAIQNARLFEQAQQEITERKRAERALERRATQLAAVNKLGQQIASILDLNELLHQMASLLEDAFGYRYVYIFLLDEDSHELVSRAAAGPAGRVLEGTRIAVEARSINACVARTGEPLLANDVSKEPMYLLIEEVADTRSELAVPIKLKGQVIGTLDVQSTALNAFDESALFTLQTLADQAAIAIENARLYEETKRWAEEMTSVYNIGVATTSTLSLDEVLRSVCEQVSRLMEVSSFYIALYDADREELSFELALDEGVPVEKFIRKIANGGGLSGWIVQSRKPLLLRDIGKEELPSEAIVVGEPAHSWLGVPLLYRDQVVGVMGVQSYQPNAFDEDDQQLLSTIAAQVAIAIENARLFAETEGKANDLGLLLSTSTAISSTLDLDHILETVAQQITTSLVATFCRITLLDETGENLVIRAASPIRDRKAEDDFGQRCSLAMVPWHKQVIETGQPVVLRHDVPELALSDEERKMALSGGVQSAALIPLIVGGRVLGVISMGEERSWERSPFTPEKVALCQSIAAQAAVAIENARLYEELQQSFVQTIAALAAAVDAKDPYTGGHSQRTTELAAAIAQELGLDDEEIGLIRYACLLHDVGKIGISEEILLKPGPLNAEEWEVVRRHPALGANIVEKAALLQKLVPVILHHHEHYDGQGYPEGLRGEDIPLKARILAVADAYEAMTSDRAYRPAMRVQQALATLRQGADEQWDGKVVEVLHEIIREQG